MPFALRFSMGVSIAEHDMTNVRWKECLLPWVWLLEDQLQRMAFCLKVWPCGAQLQRMASLILDASVPFALRFVRGNQLQQMARIPFTCFMACVCLTGLNSEFFLFIDWFPPKIRESYLLCYLIHCWKERLIHTVTLH